MSCQLWPDVSAAVAVSSGNWSNPATRGDALRGIEEDVSIPAGLSAILNANDECGAIAVADRLEVNFFPASGPATSSFNGLRPPGN